MRIAESRKSCARFIALFAMSGRSDEIVVGRGWAMPSARVTPVSALFPSRDEGGPGPSHLGTGETADLNWQGEACGLAGSVPANVRFLSGLPRGDEDVLGHDLLPGQFR